MDLTKSRNLRPSPLRRRRARSLPNFPLKAPKFPPEITDLILHNVDDQNTLFACVEVSRSMVSVSRHYTFRHIIVGHSNIAALVALLNSPFSTINHHIRFVELYGKQVHRFELSRVKRILTLPRVTMLCLYLLAWKDVPKETRSFLENSLPRLTVLRLSRNSFSSYSQFVNLLSQSLALRVLELDDIYEGSGNRPIDPLKVHLQVQKLHIRINDEAASSDSEEERIWNWFMTLPNVWPVDSLKVGPWGDGHQLIDKSWQFIQTLKSTLKDLFVSLELNTQMRWVQTFYLKDFLHLRSIKVTLTIIYPVDFDSYLIPLLSMLPNSMRHITIQIVIYNSHDTRNVDWPAFIALFKTAQLPKLNCVQLWVDNRQWGATAEKQAALVKGILKGHNAPAMFVVRPIDSDAWASGLL